MTHIAVLGFGTVGSGVYKLLTSPSPRFSQLCGPVNVKYVLARRDRSDILPPGVFVREISCISQDPQVSVVVEAIGGVTPAFKYVDECLRAGKHVVTANKELVATYGAALQKTAREHNAGFMFEAAVCGGIPLISGFSSGLCASEISSVAGVLNGTCNFILSAMERGESYEQALAKAKAEGFAEPDPSADVQGTDTLRKLCIIASIISGTNVSPAEWSARGITDIVPEQLAVLGDAGLRIKLVGRALFTRGGCELSVMPAAVNAQGFFGFLQGANNAVMFYGDNSGPIGFTGAGAGSLATAGAVCSDIAAVVRCGANASFSLLGETPAGIVRGEQEYYLTTQCSLELAELGCTECARNAQTVLWRTLALSAKALDAVCVRVGEQLVGAPLMIVEE